MRRGATLVALVWLALGLSVACNRGPAEEALTAAEQALAAAPEIESYVPEEFAAVSEALREARANLAAARYTDALRAAQPLPDRIAAATKTAANRKQESAAAWSALSGELEGRLETLATRLTALSAAATLSSERLLAAGVEIASLKREWAEATAAFARGEIGQAVASARDTKAKADALAGRLGSRTNPTAPAPTPD